MSAEYNKKKAERQIQYREKKKMQAADRTCTQNPTNKKAEIQSQYRERKKLKIQNCAENLESLENNSISVIDLNLESQQNLCDLTPNTRRLVKGKFKVPLQLKQQNDLNQCELQFIKIRRDDAGPSHAVTQSSTNSTQLQPNQKHESQLKANNNTEPWRDIFLQQDKESHSDSENSYARSFSSGDDCSNLSSDEETSTDIGQRRPRIKKGEEKEYSRDQRIYRAHCEFDKLFTHNEFGHACTVCDRLWFKKDLKKPHQKHFELLKKITDINDLGLALICSTCKKSLDKNKIPIMSTYNGFKYPPIPQHLPPLDIISERLISPRIPFMQIRRLRHVHGQYGIYGQIINVPVEINNMVHHLPRNIDDDQCINVHINRQLIHKTAYLKGLVKKRIVKEWLKYLLQTPLYKLYKITVDESFFYTSDEQQQIELDELSEDIPIEESLLAVQETLLWNDDKYLLIAPGQYNVPHSLLFDEHAEELSFPKIYLGQMREFPEELKVKAFTIASSELRRSDRRGVTPQHLLYMAMRIMRLRVRDALTVAFKHVGKNTNITRDQILSDEYIHNCVESNLAFLKTIPNSTWYWMDKKRELFAIIRQKGKPTAFLTLSANEIGWPNLLKLLLRLKNKHNEQNNSNNENNEKENHQELIDDIDATLNFIEKSTLINEDAVTCVLYFSKLVNTIVKILQSKYFSPFGKYRVVHYFKRIEFQHRGSPHAHILLWLDNSPSDVLGKDYDKAINLIDSLISVSAADASGNIKLQTHKHTFTCYKKVVANKDQKCRFEAPFMPIRRTHILTPMQKTEENFKMYKTRYEEIRLQLECNDYNDIDDFYAKNRIVSDDEYIRILRAGIKRPRIFYKRTPSEKWHNTFNPFIFSILKSNMDLQFITEEYSCAAYVVEYVNKTSRGISNLQRQIINVMNENPDFDVVEITRKLGIDMLNTVEMTSQEAAWYLLREPMSKSSVAVVYIPTIWPVERQRIRKTQKELDSLEGDSTDIWKENWFDKYEKRPETLKDVTLAQFVSKYYRNKKGIFMLRKEPRVIRYRNYDMAEDYDEYTREMVTLHIPFKNEDTDILHDFKYKQIYEQNRDLIMERRKEFESNIDIQKTIDICRQLCRENEELDDNQQSQQQAHRFPEPDPFQELYKNPNSNVNNDIRAATLKKLSAIAKQRPNVMPLEDFCKIMRTTNEKQLELLHHVIHHLISEDSQSPLQLFFTGPAGCGKTFVIKLIMEIYNRFTNVGGFYNAYITCASTGKAAVAIDGTTVHTALKISLSKLMPLSTEVAHQYRDLFKDVKVLIIDEISMIGTELLHQIDARLKQITGNFQTSFGGLDIILIGDLRQLPPVRATPIYKPLKQRMVGAHLWRQLSFFELKEVMRQSNKQFSQILTKIGNGELLEDNELELIESRFYAKEVADTLCPHGIRLFFSNQSVNTYNNSILLQAQEKTISLTIDILTGCSNPEQTALFTQKLHKLKPVDTSGLPYEIVFVLQKYYIITANIDVTDGLANGAVGQLVHIERNDDNQVTRVWLVFPQSPKTGKLLRTKAAKFIMEHKLPPLSVPITRRTVTIPLNNNKTINAKRNHFPLISACAMTIHKSQGGTFDEIVYEYEKTHPQQLLYVALSRVTNLQGLFIVTKNDEKRFYHGRSPNSCVSSLQEEFARLSLERKLTTIHDTTKNFINRNSNIGLSLTTFNCQGIRRHVEDIVNPIIEMTNLLILSETHLDNNETIQLPNFTCVSKDKFRTHSFAGVAIYHNNNDYFNTVTHQEIEEIPVTDPTLAQTTVGDLCAALCKTKTGLQFLFVAIYIRPNTSINKITQFIFRKLNECIPDQTTSFKEPNLGYIPIVLAGDFNVDFSTARSKELVNFLFNQFKLTMNNRTDEPTTRYGTTIDAVFSRYIPKIESKIFISYYSYHKPIISIINIDNTLTQ